MSSLQFAYQTEENAPIQKKKEKEEKKEKELAANVSIAPYSCLLCVPISPPWEQSGGSDTGSGCICHNDDKTSRSQPSLT
ncbi:unnamed protein product [Merluccius merluccius]